MVIWIVGACVALLIVGVVLIVVGMNGCRRAEREDYQDWTHEGGRKW